MEEREQILSEMLQKAVQVVDTVDNRYREVAFPIVLQNLLETLKHPVNLSGIASASEDNQYSKSSLPSTLSVNEFFDRVSPNSHPARLVTAAYYLLHGGKTEQFTREDIIETYHKLRQAAPKNLADIVYKCIRNAYIIDAPGGSDKQRKWIITPKGEKYVEGLMHDHTSSSSSSNG
jgi:hypothetical protein